MLLRYHWGLGVGHTYSHIRDSATDETVLTTSQSLSTPGTVRDNATNHSHTAATLLAHPNGFADLENELSAADLDVLEWELPTTGVKSGWGNDSGAEGALDLATATGISLTHPDGFDDLDAGYSGADLDAFEWATESQDEDEVDSESDDESDQSLMYEMYGSDWGDNEVD